VKRQIAMLLVWPRVLWVGAGVSAQGTSNHLHPKHRGSTLLQQAEQSPAPLQLSRKDMKKLFVKRMRPEYPSLARDNRIVGKCMLRIVISLRRRPPQGESGLRASNPLARGV
jgi:hypothetical protein